jgi:hypothetical protein
MRSLTTLLTLAITLTASAQTIVCPTDTSPNVKLAAKEIRRYVYLRTGEFLSIVSGMVGAAAPPRSWGVFGNVAAVGRGENAEISP